MAVNYEDERFAKVETDKQAAMNELEQTYSGMIGGVDDYYNAQIDASKQWAETQSKLQQEQTDFAIEQIEQQKAQAQKDYIKEQSGAFVDYKKQSDQYGAAAEQQATGGMTNTGFSESSQVSIYNTYQNRVMTAREAFNLAVMNYDNGIKEARLQNNSALAEIEFQAFQQQLELALEGFQYKNNLILEQANKKVEIDQMYHERYQDVLQQINTENAMAEEIRQFNMNYDLQVQQFNEQKRQFEQEYKEKVRQFNEEITRLKAKDAQENKLAIQQLELQKKQLAEQKRQHDAEMAYKQAQLAEQKRQFNVQQQAKATVYKSSGGGGSSTKKTTTKTTGTTSVSKTTSKTTQSNYQQALNYYNKMVAAGKTKAQVLSDITSAYKNGQLSKADYTKLKSIFNVRGVQY